MRLVRRNSEAAFIEGRQAVNRRIVGYHQDEEQHWVAELECGHSQHVRNDPPWQVRAWVTTDEGRRSRLGSTLECRRCDEGT